MQGYEDDHYRPEIVAVCIMFTLGGFIMGIVAAWLITWM
jgi:hypothetical protein